MNEKQWAKEIWEKLDKKLSRTAVSSYDKIPYTTENGVHDNRYGSETVWQRGFHDHIIRNRNDYEKISKYIFENPIIWQYDCFYTEE